MGSGTLAGTSPVDIAIAVACLALGIIWISKILPGVWRGTGSIATMFQYDSKSKEGIWVRTLWHAYVRTIPFGTTLFFVLAALLLLDYLAPASLRDSQGFDRLFIAAFVGWLLGSVSIVLFNRPKALVAPRLRDKPGLIGEWVSHVSRSR
jgi:hypothetical protein